jgi:hypothetical protein
MESSFVCWILQNCPRLACPPGGSDLLPGRQCKGYGRKSGTEIGFHLPISFHQLYINIYLSLKSVSPSADRNFNACRSHFELHSTALSVVPAPVWRLYKYSLHYFIFVFLKVLSDGCFYLWRWEIYWKIDFDETVRAYKNNLDPRGLNNTLKHGTSSTSFEPNARLPHKLAETLFLYRSV